MNEVYLRGKLVSVYEPITPASQPKHLVYQLRVSHKNAQQQVKSENYTVNAWRNLAVWAASNLQVGMEVFVRGHLSQRLNGTGMQTEVTALRITPLLVSRTVSSPVASAIAHSGGEVTAAEVLSDDRMKAAVVESHVSDASTAPFADSNADSAEDVVR